MKIEGRERGIRRKIRPGGDREWEGQGRDEIEEEDSGVGSVEI